MDPPLGASQRSDDRAAAVNPAVKTSNAKRIQKTNLPQKICPVCARPFAWRKKWARDWEDVRYCSRRCRDLRGKSDGSVDPAKARDRKAHVP
ncbi:MAG: DUF2256 domain-containing protein [Hyphomonadaceae bacterium]